MRGTIFKLPRCRRSVRCYSAFSLRPVKDADVLVVGGGPVGLALACGLASFESTKKNLKVVLVEAGDLSKIRNWSMEPHLFSNRVSSLTNTSLEFLTEIGAWKYVDQDRTCPIEDMQVWDGVSDARISFSTSELHVPATDHGMSRLTENLNLQRGLIRYLDNQLNNTSTVLLDKTRVSEIALEEGPSRWPLVALDNGDVYRARLLVGADGFNSPVRSFASISSFGWSYNTQAIVTTMNHHHSYYNHTTAFQRFLPTGPIAFLPLSPTASSLVWSTKPAFAKALQSAEPSILVQMINAAYRLPDVSLRYLHDVIIRHHDQGVPISGSQLRDEIAWRERSHNIDSSSPHFSSASLGEGVPPIDSDLLPPLVTSLQQGTTASFPLRFNHADAYVGEHRTVLVGDAAHTMHPLAGQGLNLGLGDAESLTRCIRAAVELGSDIGSHTALLPYSRERYFENHKMMSVVDKLHKLYTTTREPVVWARSVGVEVLNELDPLKAAIAMMAGASPQSQSRSPNAWELAGSAVESLSGILNVAQNVGQSFASTLGSQLAARKPFRS